MKLSRKKKLAEGAYSIVYKCKDKETEISYAVKRLMVSRSVSFCGSIREIDIVMSIQHPFIVKCHGLIVQEQAFNRPPSPMAKTYKDDGFLQVYDLYKHSLRGRETEITKPVEFAFKILLSIEFIHGRGIVHRDLKPDNILIDGEGNPRLGDFGLAQRIQNSGDDTFQTVSYRSPELLFGLSSKLYDCRSTDIWAYGCILYQLMNAGQTVFGRHFDKEDELISRMSQFVDLSLVREKGKNRYPITPRVFPIDNDVVRFILNPDPKQRPTATEILNHPFFDSVRSSPTFNKIRRDYPIFPITMDTMNINSTSKTRLASCNILINLINRQRENSSWFRYPIIFHTLELIDRIIATGKKIRVSQPYTLVISILYILVKMFNEDQVADPPSFETFTTDSLKIDSQLQGDESSTDFNKVEYHLLHDILDYEVFRRTPYEYHRDRSESFNVPPGWNDLSLIFMVYTRMPSGIYHVSNVWTKSKEAAKRSIENSMDMLQALNEINHHHLPSLIIS